MRRGMANESQDSRKRPLDGDVECGVIKRSNQGFAPDGHVQVKVLVPSVAAGAIIGKGGETITLIQKDTGASIKMSKANDYYPGTTERVCLIAGTIESVKNVVAFMMEKIREKPDPNPKPVDGELKVNLERHKQVKLLVPNSTAGMIIGKGGNFIKQVKDESGAYVQISQKSKDVSLPERCVTIAGSDPEQNNMAVEMIVEKVKEDPQSASCPNISYQDYHGPVASTNPTGSPYASNQGGGPQQQPVPPLMAPARMPVSNNSLFSSNITNNMNNLNLNSTGGTPNNIPPPPVQAPPAPMPQPPQTPQGPPIPPPGPPGPGISSPAIENLKATLRGSGYTEHATEEITAAMFTLASYGFLGMGLNIGGPSGTGLNLGGGTGLGGLNMGSVGNTAGTLSLASLANILAGGTNNPQPPPLLGSGGAPGSTCNDGGGSVFGPVGSGSSVMGAGGDADQNGSSLFSNNPGGNYPPGNSMFSESGFGSNSFNGPNQNSFGLGTNMGSNNVGNVNNGEENGGISKKEIEVGEHIVGAILGPGGRGIVELQQYSGANIQISKKGVYAPGTRNRIVSITGNSHAIARAQTLISQRITQEEAKRARQGQNMPAN